MAFLSDCEIKGLSADGICMAGGKAVVNNCNVVGNIGAGIHGTNQGRLVLSKTRVKDNKLYGVYLEGDHFRALVAQSVVAGNSKGQVKHGEGVKILNE